MKKKEVILNRISYHFSLVGQGRKTEVRNVYVDAQNNIKSLIQMQIILMFQLPI